MDKAVIDRVKGVLGGVAIKAEQATTVGELRTEVYNMAEALIAVLNAIEAK